MPETARLMKIVTVIVNCCNEKSIGSGKIAVLPRDDCVRISTKEQSEAAIL
ncbi:MAG: hypothetical protein GF375_07060 [Candidatus Omnitrophica bacterium]|nr:hypothetical protein [Candidatus Omnitrophota bacterium]MBD3269736.1 hypothetical protein [Candidatus Omnitrophota bacterium]